MIDLQVVIDRISSQTNYDVERARSIEPNLQDIATLPVVYVGYFSIDARSPSAPIAYDLYDLYGEDLVQTFDIQIVCTITDLPTIWKAVYSSLIGYTPTSTTSSLASTSGFTFAQGATQQSNGKVWDVSRWKIGFPTANVNF